ELGRQRRQPVDVIFGPAVFDRHISMLEKANLVQALSKCSHELLAVAERAAAQNTDHRRRRLLGACRARCKQRRRRHRAAEQRDERAPPHSITSSASCCSCNGTSRPSAFAVLRLTTSSN